MTVTDTGRRFGTGPLARAAAGIHTFLVVEVLILLTGAPGLVGLVLLDRNAGNIPLAAACAIPAGPALSAALYALRWRSDDLTDLEPARAFLRGYRMNVVVVLQLWVPWLAWEAILGLDLASGRWTVGVAVVAVVAALWQANVLVIASLFAFRARDTARLGAYFLVRTPKVALGNAGLAVIATGVVLLWSEAVLALFAVVFAAALLRTAGPVRAGTAERFTA